MNDEIIIELLKEINGKLDRLQQEVATLKIEDTKLNHKFDLLEEDNTTVEDRIKRVESEYNNLKHRVILLEESPKTTIIKKVDYVKKAITAGIALLITGAVVYMGRVLWQLITNMEYLMEAVNKLKGGIL